MMSASGDSLNSSQLAKLLEDAEKAIKSVKKNPSIPWAAELLDNFLRDFDRYRSKVSFDENDRERIGEKLAFFHSKVIGQGTNGTVVFEGSYEGRLVAVKRLQKSHIKLAEKEIKNLIASDHGQNIVRYHGVENDNRHVYLALELCHCNLNDLIQIYSVDCPNHQNESNNLKDGRFEKLKNIFGDVMLWKEKIGRPSPLLQKLMRDIVSGLVHLHKPDLSIIHRDLKPQNVLIRKEDSTLLAKLSDMGISRRLSKGKNSLSDHSSDNYAGTGWKSPEQLDRRRQTQATDLFSLGCILFFCITRGKHPFGEPDERDCNIKKDVKELFLIQDFPEAFHLISPLLEADPQKSGLVNIRVGLKVSLDKENITLVILGRPKANEVFHHPLFWNAKMRLYFLRDSSDCASENTNLRQKLESTAGTVFGTKTKGKGVPSWEKKIDPEVIRLMSRHGANYKFNSLRDLLRLIRNMLSHYHNKDLTNIKNLVGPLYEGFDDYFTRKFPHLFLEVYKVVYECCKKDEFFKIYFEGDQ